jgi:SAM-dependent methyltransferase
MSSNDTSAKDFFNSISGTYKNKYSERSAFHHYFFHERLHKATFGLDIYAQTVLDVGAGTGDLYDHLVEHFENFQYNASDVAEGMLANSLIPENQRFVGVVTQVDLPHAAYNKIFMLGVSTYLTQDEMQNHVRFYHSKLSKDGLAIISFTNKYCLDGFFRNLLRPIIRIFKRDQNVLAGGFKIKRYSLKEAKRLFEENGFVVEQVDYLNHTVFPFNLIFKRPSVWLAKKMDRIKSGPFISFFSSDFLIRARKSGE